MNEKPGIKLEEDNPKKDVLGCLLPLLVEGGIPILLFLIYLLFKEVIRNRGRSYEKDKKVTNFHKSKNKISALVKGTTDYNVSVEYLENNKISVSCECECHKSTDIYCKHVYALILTLKLMYEKEKLLKIYNRNKKRIEEISDLIIILLKENQKYFYALPYNFYINIKKEYEDYIKRIDEFLDKDNIYKINSSVKYSYEYLASITERYNELIDVVKKGKIEYKKLEEEKKNNNDVITTTICESGDGIARALDNIIASLPLEILEKAREDDIRNGEDTNILDRAIERRKKEDAKILASLKKQKEVLDEIEKNMKKARRRGIFFELLSNMFDSNTSYDKSNDYDLLDYEKELVNKGEYEPYNFEEEKVDEDDFYYEDD